MRRHEHHVNWRLLLVYGVASIMVLLIGGLAIISFFERQSLVGSVAAEPLPRLTVVTSRPDSKLAAAWVSLLTTADFSPTLVSVRDFRPPVGVVALCDVETFSPPLEQYLSSLRTSGGLAILGPATTAAFDAFGVRTETTKSDGAVRISEASSPLLARLDPGHRVGVQPAEVAALVERPGMQVDARWEKSARAAAAHFVVGNARVVWIGIDPAKLHQKDDRQLALFLRTTFRWLDGQPVSDGAVGLRSAARTLAPESRRTARAKRLSFSVDRMEEDGLFSVRILNRGDERLENPTVKFWLPPGVSRVSLAGTTLSRRGVSVDPVEGERAVLISLMSLRPHEDRLFRLRAE